jgi:hypothetical protein
MTTSTPALLLGLVQSLTDVLFTVAPSPQPIFLHGAVRGVDVDEQRAGVQLLDPRASDHVDLEEHVAPRRR